METKTIVPGFINCIVELIINARDQNYRDPLSNKLHVTINRKKQYVQVYNNGNGICTDYIKDMQLYNPQAAFFVPRTSTNYNDNIERFTGGKNGLGAKIVSILSKKFTVETVYKNNDTYTYYRQSSINNLD